MHGIDKRIVYIIRSDVEPPRPVEETDGFRTTQLDIDGPEAIVIERK